MLCVVLMHRGEEVTVSVVDIVKKFLNILKTYGL